MAPILQEESTRGEAEAVQALRGRVEQVFHDPRIDGAEMFRRIFGAIEMLEGGHHVVCGPAVGTKSVTTGGAHDEEAGANRS